MWPGDGEGQGQGPSPERVPLVQSLEGRRGGRASLKSWAREQQEAKEVYT